MVYIDESLKTAAAGLTRNRLGKTLLVSSYTNRRATGISSARKEKETKIKNQKLCVRPTDGAKSHHSSKGPAPPCGKSTPSRLALSIGSWFDSPGMTLAGNWPVVGIA
jgi:hypothetical protein